MSTTYNEQSYINEICQKYNKDYSCYYVSWNDNVRHEQSCYGSNITDSTIKGKGDKSFLCIRSNNFNERIGKVRAKDVNLIIQDSAYTRESGYFKNISLSEYLENFYKYSSYIFPNTCPISLYNEQKDEIDVSIRFQAVFIPLIDGKRTIYTASYNYQTISDNDPKNIILLSTSQGTFVNHDKKGVQSLFLHNKDKFQEWSNYYMEVEETKFDVCKEQVETLDERKLAIESGKSTSQLIGLRSMGEGFNRLMTIQIPLEQIKKIERYGFFNSNGFFNSKFNSYDDDDDLYSTSCMPKGISAFCYLPPAPPVACSARCMVLPEKKKAKTGRLSYGERYNKLEQNTEIKDIKRDINSPITITVQYYFTYPENHALLDEDIRHAIDICENSLIGCNWNGKLMDKNPEISFMKD